MTSQVLAVPAENYPLSDSASLSLRTFAPLRITNHHWSAKCLILDCKIKICSKLTLFQMIFVSERITKRWLYRHDHDFIWAVYVGRSILHSYWYQSVRTPWIKQENHVVPAAGEHLLIRHIAWAQRAFFLLVDTMLLPGRLAQRCHANQAPASSADADRHTRRGLRASLNNKAIH